MKMIDDHEGKILRATLELSSTPISKVMKTNEEIFSLDINTVLDRE
jgi:CBS domain containing-hemolysin-like protein